MKKLCDINDYKTFWKSVTHSFGNKAKKKLAVVDYN